MQRISIINPSIVEVDTRPVGRLTDHDRSPLDFSLAPRLPGQTTADQCQAGDYAGEAAMGL